MTGASFFHGATILAYVLHVGGGTVGLVAGFIAIFAPKGGLLHRTAGTVFFASMLVMGAFAAYLAIVVPGQIANLFGGGFVIYLVATAWLTVHRRTPAIVIAEKLAFAAIALLFLCFAVTVLQIATGISLLPTSAPPIRGPQAIAFYVITFVIGVAAFCDAKLVFAGGITGASRIARHLWRMCTALVMATGSAFTNGVPRLLPGPMHVTGIYFLPMLVPFGLLIYWMIRVRFTGWFKPAVTQPA